MTSESEFKDNQVELDVEEEEKEVESETEENQAEHEHDAETEKEQIEKNNEHEIEDLQAEERNTKHKNKRSWVWDYFTYDEIVKKARCIYCKVLIVCSKGSTSGIANHIKSKHKLIKEKEKNQLTIYKFVNNNSGVIVNIIFISFFFKKYLFYRCNDNFMH
jgi:hypothetical protein